MNKADLLRDGLQTSAVEVTEGEHVFRGLQVWTLSQTSIEINVLLLHEERHSEQSFGSHILELAPYENPLWKYFFWLQMSGVCSLKNSSSGEFRTRTNYRVMPAESGKSLKLKVHKWCARMLEGKKEDEEKEGKRKKKNYKEYEEK